MFETTRSIQTSELRQFMRYQLIDLLFHRPCRLGVANQEVQLDTRPNGSRGRLVDISEYYFSTASDHRLSIYEILKSSRRFTSDVIFNCSKISLLKLSRNAR